MKEKQVLFLAVIVALAVIVGPVVIGLWAHPVGGTNDRVSTSMIEALAVTAAKLASGAVTTDKLASSSVTTAKMYLDLPAMQIPCITTGKLLGSCGNLTAATGVCNTCN